MPKVSDDIIICYPRHGNMRTMSLSRHAQEEGLNNFIIITFQNPDFGFPGKIDRGSLQKATEKAVKGKLYSIKRQVFSIYAISSFEVETTKRHGGNYITFLWLAAGYYRLKVGRGKRHKYIRFIFLTNDNSSGEVYVPAELIKTVLNMY